MSQDNDELRQKIDEAKRRVPLPDLLARLDLADHAKKSAHCPFPGHEDKHPSFSVFKGEDGFWKWKCFSACGAEGDELDFLVRLKGISKTQAMSLYFDMAGFPPCSPPVSREYRVPPASLSFCVSESPVCPEFPEFPVSPVSEGQATEENRETALKLLAAGNACAAPHTAREKRFKVLRDIAAFQKGLGRKLKVVELMFIFDEWHRLSLPFLDAAKTRERYLAAFLGELGKVRVPTGEGTLAKALQGVAKVSPCELPMIPEMPDAPEAWRRIVALHRELSVASGGNVYFLSYRDAARAVPGMSHQEVYNITLALEPLGVITIAAKGQPGLKGKAAEFLYLVPGEQDSGLDL